MDIFTKGYINAALWSSSDDNNLPLDYNYNENDISPETMERMISDCKKFQDENKELLQKEYYLVNGYNYLEIAGHDFWLTRNRHGAGFFDGDWQRDVGEKLTAAAHEYGEIDLYIGDDGKIHQ